MKKLLVTLVSTFAMLTVTASAFAQKAERPNWLVGDKWEYKVLQRNDGNKVSAYQHEVEKITDDKLMIRTSGKNSEGVYIPGALLTYSADMNYMTRTGKGGTSTPDSQYLNWPLENNKKYPAEFSWVNSSTARAGKDDYKVVVSGPEDITVEAGTFKAYKLTAKGFWNRSDQEFRGSGQISQTIWYAPEIKRWVKWETQSRDTRSSLFEDRVEELVKYTPGK